MAKRRYEIDDDKIRRWLAQGRGSGTGQDYKPFLRVQDVPSLGRRTRILGRKTGRLHHLLSDLETSAFLQADWQDNVTDIQEQFPLDREVTRRIARGMRVRHPCDTKTATDIVMTTDLVLTRHARRHAYTVKYLCSLAGRGAARVLEKLEIERRYWQLHGVPFTVVTELHLPKVRRDNLAWLHPYHNVARNPWPRENYWRDRGCELLRIMRRVDSEVPLQVLIAKLERSDAFVAGEALSLLRWLLSVKIASFDLGRRFDVRWPLAALTLPSGAIH
jgi:TnsA endonuclease-like protein